MLRWARRVFCVWIASEPSGRTPDQLATTIGTDRIYQSHAVRAEGAFVGIDKHLCHVRQRHMASRAFGSHFQCHLSAIPLRFSPARTDLEAILKIIGTYLLPARKEGIKASYSRYMCGFDLRKASAFAMISMAVRVFRWLLSISASNLGPRLRPVAFCGVAISLPPIETADQFAHLIAQRQQFQSCLCRGVATDAVAVADIDLGRVEQFDRIETDRLVGQIDRARNTLFGIGFGRTTIDDDNGFARTQSHVEIRRIHLVSQLALVVVHLIHAHRFLFLTSVVSGR